MVSVVVPGFIYSFLRFVSHFDFSMIFFRVSFLCALYLPGFNSCIILIVPSSLLPVSACSFSYWSTKLFE